MNRLSMFAAFGAMAFLAACTSYYEIKDPTSDKVYYTTSVDQNRDGSIRFTDASGAEVTLQSSEKREVDKDTFKANTEKD